MVKLKALRGDANTARWL